MKLSRATLASLFSGLLLVTCYAPYDLWPLAYVALVPIMVVCSNHPVRTALYYGLMGVVLAIGIYYGVIGYGLNAFLLTTLTFVFAFALWGGLSSWLLSKYPQPALKIFAPALLWVGIETLVGNSQLGAPIYLGLSHAEQPWLIQSASWFGISAVSFLIVLANSTITYLLVRDRKTEQTIGPVLIASAILLANPVLGYWKATSPLLPSTTLRVAAIQPHINSETYDHGWQRPENRIFMQNTLLSLTQQAVKSGAQMIFWAEGGNGYMNMRVPALRESLSTIAKDGAVDLIISSRDMNTDGKSFNSIFSISPTGDLLGRYDKNRLLPLAEANFTAGLVAQPLPTSQAKLGAVICYESSFPEPSRLLTAQGAELLFVTSSEATFKRSPLAIHNARLAVFRAVENQRWLIRAANTGPSLIVSPHGDIMHRTNFYTRGILTGNVGTISKLSFFTWLGYLLPIFIAINVAILSVYIVLLNFQKQHQHLSITPSFQKGKRLMPSILAGGLIFVIFISATITSSLYVLNRESLNSKAIFNDLLAEIFLPTTIPLVDTTGERFLQVSSNTCGAAALAYVLSFLGRETKEDEITKMVKLNERGTSMLELKGAANRLQFSAVGVSENYTALSMETMPVIAYINDSHYLVITEVGRLYINAFDPALGHVRLERGLFERSWNGYLLIVRPEPIPENFVKSNQENQSAREQYLSQASK